MTLKTKINIPNKPFPTTTTIIHWRFYFNSLFLQKNKIKIIIIKLNSKQLKLDTLIINSRIQELRIDAILTSRSVNLIISSHDPLLEQQEVDDINEWLSSKSSSKLGLEHLSSVTIRWPELTSSGYEAELSDLIITRSWRLLVTLLLTLIEILICLDLFFVARVLVFTPTWAAAAAAATFTIATSSISLECLTNCNWILYADSWRRGLRKWYLRDGEWWWSRVS
jgi:hypothetical protein